MAKIIIFIPANDMLKQAENVIQSNHYDAKAVYTDSENVLEILEYERKRGALVAVARGNHAHIIKDESDMPLTEIRLNGQELATLISNAQSLFADKSSPIALVGFYNMFSDPEPIAKALGANVKVYYAENSAAIAKTVAFAHEEGAKIVVGGELAIKKANMLGMQTLFINSTESSISDALATARRIQFGIEMEKQRTMEFMSLLDYSFDALIKLNADGKIIIANYLAEKAFHKPASQLIGCDVNTLMEIRKDSLLANAISQRKNIYSATVQIKQEEYVVNLAVLYNGGIFDGYILSMQEFKHIDAMEEKIRQNRSSNEKAAKRALSEYTYPSECMNQLKEDATVIAQYDLPLLITGVFGTDKVRLAECVHNSSNRYKRAFVRMDLSTLTPSMQEKQMIASDMEKQAKSVFELAHNGTLLIENVELLDSGAQALLLNILKNKWIISTDGRPKYPVNTRIICTTDVDLKQLAAQGQFSNALYTYLSRMILRVPSLYERKEDVEQIIGEHVEKCSTTYKKYVRLQSQALAILVAYPWEEDELSLGVFIERLILLSSSNESDEYLVRRLLRITEGMLESMNVPTIVNSAEEAQLIDALKAYHGNRTLMAQALNISKTTLWRRLKKYQLDGGSAS